MNSDLLQATEAMRADLVDRGIDHSGTLEDMAQRFVAHSLDAAVRRADLCSGIAKAFGTRIESARPYTLRAEAITKAAREQAGRLVRVKREDRDAA